MDPYNDARYYMAEIAFATGTSYEIVNYLCMTCVMKLGFSWEGTLAIVRRILS